MSLSLRNRAALVVRLAETWFHRPSTPNRLVMAVTRRCNLRCAMCRTWSVEPGRPALTPDEIGTALRPLPRLTWLDVTGGEILVRKDAEALFDAILDAAPSLRVLHYPTNGWFRDRAVSLTRRILERRPDVDLIITVSIDGPRDVHDAVRGRAGAFDRALETLLALRAIPGASTYVGTTVTADNVAHLPALERALVAALPDFAPRDWHWNWPQVSPHYFHNEGFAGAPLPDPALLESHIRRRGLPRNMVELAELGFLLNLAAHLRGEASRIPCQALRSTAFLSPEGDLYPCHVWDRPLGNVRERSIPEIWRSPELRVARNEVCRGDCPGCFTACEAYPAMAGAPWATIRQTLPLLRRLVL